MYRVVDLRQQPDEQLAPCAPEDHRCLEVLLERYEQKIRACAWKMVGDPNEIDDLTQEALLRVIRSLPGFRARSSFSTWVYQVAHNTCVDAYRRRSRAPLAAVQLEAEDGEPSPAEQLVADGTDPEALLEDAIAECYVEQALRELSPDYAEIAALRLLDGWSNEEIAGRLGLSVDAVKGKLKRARARLREHLAESRECPLCSAGSFRFDVTGLV
jgi:RNA polymerase sigma-70 factor (ECF subfamily)